MNFFQHQVAARRNTRMMVMLYLLAVAGVIIAVDLVLSVAWIWASYEMELPRDSGWGGLFGIVPDQLLIWGAGVTGGVIAAASLYNIIKLMSGGAAVAKMAGARPVSLTTRDPLERRLLNVVEEMAIASGVRVPTAWVMDGEPGINAFAAGYNVNNAVVAVTRGTLESLSRDELQGVIGHEFSHILNGDMWLNIRMMGVLAGIVFIASIGGFIMRGGAESGDRAGFALIAFGFAIWLMGSVGNLFARMIKSAVSRQREFLADASSVQFTRNPDGIAGALDQIRSAERGALVQNRYAEEMSHMYFAQGIDLWTRMFDTHPPIDDRIARVRPGFLPSRYRERRAKLPAADAPATPSSAPSSAASGFAGASPGAPAGSDFSAQPVIYDGRIQDRELRFDRGPGQRREAWGAGLESTSLNYDGQRRSDAAHAWGRSASESVALVGTLDAGKVDYATRMLGELTPQLREAMREQAGAGAVLIATLLAPKEEVLQTQLDAMRALFLDSLADRASELMPQVRRFGRGYDLMLIDLCLPALKASMEEDKRRLLAGLEAVIRADRRVSLHEFIVLTLAKSQLTPVKTIPGAKRPRIQEVKDELTLIMSLVAHSGVKPLGPNAAAGEAAEQSRAVANAFQAGVTAAALDGTQLLPRDKLSLDAAGTALEKLATVAPMTKAIVVKALFAVVTADGNIRLAEAELMRLIGAVLDCPLPPLMEDIDPATLVA